MVLDVMMPGKSGIDLCRGFEKDEDLKRCDHRHAHSPPGRQIQIEALNVGADDYITKPFKPSVFISRIQALLRRIDTNKSQALVFNELVIDPGLFNVSIEGKIVDLPKKNSKYSISLHQSR